jgi:glyoxylase-like metal-dependent hydrolase (beta-lactamase superfamily II)
LVPLNHNTTLHAILESVEVAPGLVMISHLLGPRRVNFYAISSGSDLTLFDTGMPNYAAQWLHLRGLPNPTKLIISHADTDHFGGAGLLKKNHPATLVLTHPKDRRWIESPSAIVEERYHCAHCHGVEYLEEVRAALLDACGGGVGIDLELDEGSNVAVGSDAWKVLHVPGHSPGHIALWSEPIRTLLLGDAVLGFGVPDCAGGLSMPPTHQFIGDYLETLGRLECLEADLVLTGHWPPLDGEQFKKLLADSRECVNRDLAFVRSRALKGPLTFTEHLDALCAQFRAWPEEASIHYFYALLGYVEYLADRGEVVLQNSVISAL